MVAWSSSSQTDLTAMPKAANVPYRHSGSLKDHRRFDILNPKKWSFGCWDGFPFQSSVFQFPMFLFWLDHSNIFGAHLVKGKIFQCIPKLWWFIPKDSLKEERSFFQNKFWNGRFPCEFDAFKYFTSLRLELLIYPLEFLATLFSCCWTFIQEMMVIVERDL